MSTPFCRQKVPEIWRETIKQQPTFPIVLMHPTLCVLYVSFCKEELSVTLFIKFRFSENLMQFWWFSAYENILEPVSEMSTFFE
jgi:hypothetical protein